MGLEFHQRMFPQRRKLYLCSVKFSGLQENSLINTEQCIYLKNDFNNNTVNKFLIMLHLHQHKTSYNIKYMLLRIVLNDSLSIFS